VKKFGIAAILTFVDKGASRAMGRVGKIAETLQKRFRGIGAGVAQMTAGMGKLAMGMLPVTAGFGFMIKDGMKFEQSMANLRSVTLDTSGKMTESLKGLAKTMGATTKFSASEAADAMTNLARASLDVNQVASAIPGTLAAAAAEGIDLATAADMVASNLKAFKIDAKEASTVASSLALVSARTNTNMVSLQEGMKLAATTANLAGFNFKETALTLGMLADIGVKGTMAGTALRGAMSQLLSPTKKVLKAVGGRAGLNKIIKDGEGNMRSMSEIMFGFSKKLKEIPDRAKRVDVAMKIFGKRAVAVMGAFDLTGTELEKFTVKQRELGRETGSTADIMKALQMRTLGGQFKLVRSAVEALNIELFGMISSEIRGGVSSLASNIGKLSLALRVVRGEKIMDPETQKQVKMLPKSFLEMAKGIKEGFAEAKATLKSFWNTVKGIFRMFGIGTDDSTKGTAKLITKIVTLGAVFAPVALAVGGVSKLFGGLTSVAIGAGKAMFHTLALATKGAVGAGGGIASLLGQGVGGAGAAAGGGLAGLKAGTVTLAKNFAKLALGAAAAGAAGFAFGTWLDNKLGISDKLANGLNNLFSASEEAAARQRVLNHEQTVAVANATKMANTYAKLSQTGLKTIEVWDGAKKKRVALTQQFAQQQISAFLKKQNMNQAQIASTLASMSSTFRGIKPASKIPTNNVKPIKPAKDAMISSGGMIPVSAGDVVLDRASLASAIVSQMRGGLAGRAGGGALGGGDPGRVSPPPASPSGPLQLTIPIQINGREIAIAVAEVQLDELERNGSSMNPGDRRNLLERGFIGGS
jgi:TP901 family phage tail tape measure protein